MNINEVYELVNFIANKEVTGNPFKPSQFNLIAKVAQMDFINRRLGNIKTMQDGVPPFGYRSTRKIDIDLRPLIYREIIPIDINGNFQYPDRFLWPDAAYKTDYKAITELDEDEYPRQKTSSFDAPDENYPAIIYRNPYGFIDPYHINNFVMSYVKSPPDPIWGYQAVNDVPVYDPSISQDFVVNPYTNAHFEIVLIMLGMVGIRMDMDKVLAYSSAKEAGTS